MENKSCSLEKAKQILLEVCGGTGFKDMRKKKYRGKMVETDIDIFADENQLQHEVNRSDCSQRKDVE